MKRALPYGLALATCGVAITFASPPTPTPESVRPNKLAEGIYPEFTLNSDKHVGLDFKAMAKTKDNPNEALRVIVREHSYDPDSSTGWHGHPGPVFITVVEGTLTFYEYDDPTCTGVTVSAGGGYVDNGHGHIAVNEDLENPARDISVIIAPPDGPFRIDEGFTAPNSYCGF